MRLVLLLLLLGVHLSACSRVVDEKNTASQTPNPMLSRDSPANIWVRSRSNLPSRPIDASSPTPRDVVRFDGKNYIKKNGWKTPSKQDAYKDEDYDQGDAEEVTKSGKRVLTKKDLYLIRPAWLHSQDFIYEGRELDNLKGTLETYFFTETSVNGKVFRYSITVEKVVPPHPSDGEPHTDPFVYEIMDSDGDGIFETLIRDHDEIAVPNWVLKS